MGRPNPRTRFRDNKQKQLEAMIWSWIKKPPTALYVIGVGPKSEAETLKELWPDMQVYGCEPHPRAYEDQINRFPGELLKVAIHEDPMVDLHLHPDGLRSSVLLKAGEAERVMAVRAMTLDEFDAHCGRPDHVLVWMDIEGYELQALKTGSDLMASRRVTWLNIEVRHDDDTETPEWEDNWTRPSVLRKWLHQQGYDERATYNRHPTHHDAIYMLRSVPKEDRWR